MARCGQCVVASRIATGWLMIFDRRKAALPIAERLRTEDHSTPKGLSITVIHA